MPSIVRAGPCFTEATDQSARRRKDTRLGPLKMVFAREIVPNRIEGLFRGKQQCPRTWVHDPLDQLTICQRAVIGLRIEVNFNHLTPSSCDQNAVQLFCVFVPPVCVYSSCYAPAVDNVEVRGTKVESGLFVRSSSSRSTRLGVTFGSGRQPRGIGSGAGREGSFGMQYPRR